MKACYFRTLFGKFLTPNKFCNFENYMYVVTDVLSVLGHINVNYQCCPYHRIM